MKGFEKMTVRELIVFLLAATFAGLMIGIGGTASLLSAVRIGGGFGKFIGGFIFSLGLYVILTYEMKLFTGMVPLIPTMGVKNTWRLSVCFVCNAIGVGIVAWMVSYMPIYTEVSQAGSALIGAKLDMDTWAMNAILSGVLCGVLITASVWSLRYAPQKGLSTTMGVILPIIVFAFCGFDHSVANMLYFYFLGELSWRVVGYILLSIVGNVIGGVLFPLVAKLRASETDKTA